MTEPMIYSYRRVSTLKQVDGSGMEIQTDEELLKRLSEKYGLEPSPETIDDIGVSSFRGRNVEEGELGVFMKAVSAGEVSKGSILAMQNLDRLSRQGVDAGQHIYTSLRKAGIKIYSAHDDKLFGEKPDEDVTDSINASIIFKRAWYESDVKSKRTTSTAHEQIKAFLRGEGKDDKGVKAIKVAGTSVWWVDESDGYVRPHKRLFPIAKEICKRIADGWGTNRLIGWLNSTYEPPIRRKKNTDSSPWSHSTIQRLHKNTALYGEKRFKLHLEGREDENGNTLKPEEFVLPDYYPALISKDEFLALQEARRQRTPKRGLSEDKRYVSLLTGMKLTFCLNCEDEHPHPIGTLQTKKGYRRLFCIYGSRGGDSVCTGWSTQAKWIEKPLLDLCKDKIWRVPEVDNTQYLAGLSKEEDLNKRIRKLVLLVEGLEGEDIPEVTERIKELRVELNKQKEWNEAEQSRIATKSCMSIEHLQDEWGDVTAKALKEDEHEARQKVRDLLCQSVEGILIGRNKSNEVLTIYISFVDGDERIICCRGEELLSFASIGTPAAKTNHYVKHEFPKGTDLAEAVKLVQRDAVNLYLAEY